MSAVLQSPADIINDALVRIGYKLRIASLQDGSEAASEALNIYGQTRDEMLRNGNWMFAQKTATLTLLKSAPAGGYIPPTQWNPTTNPPLPYSYEYLYPDDCLKVRAVKSVPLFLFNPDPQPKLFTIGSDTLPDTESELATLALASAGTGTYAPGDIVTLTGGVQKIPAVMQVTTTQAVSATVAAAGTGGTPGSATVTGTTGTGTKFQATVTISGGGTISSVDAISLAGSYTVNPTAPSAEPVTGASLTGAQLNVKLGILTFTIGKPGVFTTESMTFTQNQTSGDGTGATFNTATYTDLSPSKRVILCNVPDAVAVYTRQVTSVPEMDVDFVEALAAALGRRLAPVLVSMDAAQLAAQDEVVSAKIAEMNEG